MPSPNQPATYFADGSKTLNLFEFKQALRESMVGVSDVVANSIFAHFDREKRGEIRYEEFLTALRGEPSPDRLRIISLAFSTMDLDGTNLIEPQDMIAQCVHSV